MWLTRHFAIVATTIVLAVGTCNAQPAPTAAAWSFSASASNYIVPGSNYVQPSFNADRSWLHLEARYNYENLDTGSLWFGYNFSGVKTVEWELTPMIGGVFGDTTGIAPGFKGSIAWWKLELYSENEYVVDTDNHSDSFFYDWSELTLSPVDRFRFGLVTQRTRAYKSDREIQRGLLAGASFNRVNLTGYFFNPDDDKPSFVFAVEVKF